MTVSTTALSHPMLWMAVVTASLLPSTGCLLPEPSTTCLDDSACASGTLCAFGLCVDPSDARLDQLDVEVEPVATSGLSTQSLLGLRARPSAGDRTQVTLRGPATLRGLAEVDAGEGGLAGVVSATPGAFIPGRLRVTSTSLLDGRWALPVVDGTSYRLGVVPLDPRIAPAVVTDAVIAGAADDDILLRSCRVAERAPEQSTCPILVTGVVIAGEGVGAPGVKDLEARIVDDAGRRLSTLSRTDDEGRFLIGLPEPVGEAVLELVPTVDNAVQPALRRPLVLEGTFLDLGVISQGPRGDTVTVAGRVVLDDGSPAGNATVTLRGLVGAGEFVARTQTRNDGSFALPVRPGRYVVGAVGAIDVDHGLAISELIVDEAALDLTITLLPRVSATFSILHPDGAAVMAASIVLQRIGNSLGVAEPVLADVQPAFLGATNDDGDVTLRVDFGRYRITVTPPRDAGLPAFSALLSIEGPVSRTLTLPPSTLFAGVVHGPSGALGGGVVVRVFSPLTDELGRAISLGEAVTADDGSFSVAVPNLRPGL
jgi:hypothetical protein